MKQKWAQFAKKRAQFAKKRAQFAIHQKIQQFTIFIKVDTYIIYH